MQRPSHSTVLGNVFQSGTMCCKCGEEIPNKEEQSIADTRRYHKSCRSRSLRGPQFGPELSSENVRNFSDEQIRLGRDAQVGLPADSNSRQAGCDEKYS